MHDDFPILAAVAANPTHPYALLEHLGAMGGPVSRSTLYRRIEALVAQGWLEADDIRGEGGHYRRALALSKSGRARVERETAEALRGEALESPLFALSVAAAEAIAPAALAQVLRPRMAAAARRLTEEERTLRGPGSEWTTAASQRRVAHLQADIGWLQGLMARKSA